MAMHLVEGPFRVLEGHWYFTPVASNGCRIDFSLRFQFSNPLKSALFEPLFEETAGSWCAPSWRAPRACRPERTPAVKRQWRRPVTKRE